MELEHRDKRDSYIYDPVIKGFDGSFWSTITGTPTVSNGAIVLNAATIASYGLHEFVQQLDFNLLIITAPAGGQSRRFGLYSPAGGSAAGYAYFDVTGTVFTVNISDNSGNVQSAAITWQSAWTNNPITYGIHWETNRIQFWINGAIVATFSPTATAAIPFGALPLYVKNGVADNSAINWINVLRPAGIV